MSFSQLLLHSLLFGGILSLLLSILILGSMYWNAEIWLNDYPPDIRKKFGPMSAKAKRQRIPVAILFFVVAIGVLVLSTVRLQQISGDDLVFLTVFASTFIIILVFNAVDLLLIDWLIFIVIRPSLAILPGTEGSAGYSDFDFHFKGFLVGLLLGLVVSLITAGITIWLT